MVYVCCSGCIQLWIMAEGAERPVERSLDPSPAAWTRNLPKKFSKYQWRGDPVFGAEMLHNGAAIPRNGAAIYRGYWSGMCFPLVNDCVLDLPICGPLVWRGDPVFGAAIRHSCAVMPRNDAAIRQNRSLEFCQNSG